MSEPRWTTLTEAAHRMEAEIIKEALEAQGFLAEIFQDGAMHAYLGNVGGKIEVCVPSTHIDEARIWLAEYEEGQLVDVDDDAVLDPDDEDSEADE